MAVAKRVISFSSGTWIPCCWFECDKPGYEMHKSIYHEHGRNVACHDPRAEHINFVFCSNDHRMLYLNSHISYGNYPAGYKRIM